MSDRFVVRFNKRAMPLFASALLLVVPALAQSPEAKVIDAAAEALGGKARVMAVKSLIIEGSGIQPNIGQNPDPMGPLNNWNVPEFKRAIDVQNGRMRIDQHRVAAFKFALATDVKQTFSVDGDVAFNAGNNGPARAGDAVAKDRRIDMLGNPIVIVRAALDPAAKFSNLKKKGNLETLDLTTAKGDSVTIAFDAKTKLPASVSWMSSSENLGDVLNSVAFSNYETVSGVKLPKRYLTTMDFRNWVTQDINVSKNTVDGDVGDLSAPAAVKSAAAPVPPPARVDVIPVGKGLWWLQGSGNAFSALIEFDNHMTLFEAPTSEARSKAVIDKARTVVPNKPLTEVIVTHHHFDHTGGLRTAVAEGLTVISHKNNEAIFKEVTSRRATLKPDLLAKSGKKLQFRGFDDSLTLKDATNEVILYHVKDDDHAPYLIMAWAPREKIFLQGDLIDVGWTQHPWADIYANNLKLRGIEFTKDVPVHGKIATRAEEIAAIDKTRK